MYRKFTGEIITSLLILLFTYAVVSKLADYHKFVYQLSRSPLINNHAAITGWAVLAAEITTVLLLLSGKARNAGLTASVILMAVFSGYIGFMLMGKQRLPCSCGGILQGLSWKAHLIFNLAFTSLAAYGLYLRKQNENDHAGAEQVSLTA